MTSTTSTLPSTAVSVTVVVPASSPVSKTVVASPSMGEILTMLGRGLSALTRFFLVYSWSFCVPWMGMTTLLVRRTAGCKPGGVPGAAAGAVGGVAGGCCGVSGAALAGAASTGGKVTPAVGDPVRDPQSTRLNSSHANNSYAAFCLKTKNNSDGD